MKHIGKQREMQHAFHQWRSFVNERNEPMKNQNSRRDFLKLAPVATAALAGAAALSVASPVIAQEAVSPDLQSLIRAYEALQCKRDKIDAKIAEICKQPDICRQASITLSEVVKSSDMFPPSLLSQEVFYATDLEFIFEKVKMLAQFNLKPQAAPRNSGFDEWAWHEGFLDACNLLKTRQQEKNQRVEDSGLLAAEAQDNALHDQQIKIMPDIQAFQCASLADVHAKVSFASAHLGKYYDGCEATEVLLDFITTLRVSDQKLSS
jgi:hypothetical protein